MKILVAADMEGISGVVHWDQVDPAHKEYDRFRKVMTADVNAAVRGACEAGADEVIVADGHGSGRNILVEELDARARLNSGSPSPLGMVQGADAGIDAAMFVGYHARVGSQNAILDHTWSGTLVQGVSLNGRTLGEIGLNAAVCGHFGAPVLMIAGDQAACAEAVDLLGEIETAVVKRAHGRMAAECLPPAVAQQRIEDAAREAVRRFLAGSAPAPLRFDAPITAGLQFAHSDMADRAALLPGARRVDGRQVEIVTDSVVDAYRAFRAAVSLARP
ncbi:MAG: M55 family metallopeptidase [Anaerolineae bacterium]|nr:M55 family metallopeptidase [Anaerolineae bacterium]